MIFGGTQLINRPPAARYSGPVEADGRPSLRHAENRGLDTGCYDSNVTLGHYHRANLRNRGLEDSELFPLLEAKRFPVTDQASAMEWHAVESCDGWDSFRWSGPSPISVLVLPVTVPRRFRL